MASSSPINFLTISRRLVAHRTLYRPISARPAALRPFGTSINRYSSGGKLSTDDSVTTTKMPDDKHTTNKKDTLDVQSDSSSKGMQAKSNQTGGSATSESDSQNSTAKAKKEHPEAPDVVIGMQDERGGKGA
ncbi:hypothetical protein LTR50_000381 [Elasticomyces elasticus]|nr:hypothetical protein LTR50_000381 [Elasticomyces elasticus]